MKLTVYIITASALMFFTFSACTIDDDSPMPSDSISHDPFQQGTWRITLFNDSGEDEVYHFTGYTFTFDSTGMVTAIKNSSSVYGIWRTKTDDNRNELIFDFGSTTPFDELNDDWTIIEKTDLKIKLEDVSGGNEANDLLTFERN